MHVPHRRPSCPLSDCVVWFPARHARGPPELARGPLNAYGVVQSCGAEKVIPFARLNAPLLIDDST